MKNSFISILIFFLSCNNEKTTYYDNGTIKEDNNRDGNYKTYYESGQLKEEGKHDKNGFKFFKYYDKNGVLLSQSSNKGGINLYSYYADTLISTSTFITVFKEKTDDGRFAQEDSAAIFSHNPNKVLLKYKIKEGNYIITYCHYQRSMQFDTLSKSEDIETIIDSVLGQDALLPKYIPRK